MDFKESVQKIADDLAEKHYEGDYFNLPVPLRNKIWKKAEEIWISQQGEE